jgi:hypothetical protein
LEIHSTAFVLPKPTESDGQPGEYEHDSNEDATPREDSQNGASDSVRARFVPRYAKIRSHRDVLTRIRHWSAQRPTNQLRAGAPPVPERST